MYSCFKLFYVFHKKIAGGSIYKPMDPIQFFKHHQQYRYNRGKPGLDKNTEVGLRIYKLTPVSFETKYELKLLYQIDFNCCRVEIVVTVLKPWIIQLERSGKRYLTVEQVRLKFHNTGTIDDYVQKFAE